MGEVSESFMTFVQYLDPMPEIKRLGTGGLERPRIKAAGCGGAGCNIIKEIPPTSGIELIGVNDMPHPSLIDIQGKVYLGKEGLREIAFIDDRVVRKLETNVEKNLERELAPADLIFILSGLGGETGGWSSSIVARVGNHIGATTFSIVTLPFSVEGQNRRSLAEESLSLLKTKSHGVLTFSNDSLLKIAPNLPLIRAFHVMGQIMVRPILDLSKVLTREDLLSLRNSLKACKNFGIGLGEGRGQHRHFLAVEEAFQSPWFSGDTYEAKEAIILIGGEVDAKIEEEVLREVGKRAPEANVLWGSFEERLAGKIRVTVIIGF